MLSLESGGANIFKKQIKKKVKAKSNNTMNA